MKKMTGSCYEMGFHKPETREIGAWGAIPEDCVNCGMQLTSYNPISFEEFNRLYNYLVGQKYQCVMPNNTELDSLISGAKILCTDDFDNTRYFLPGVGNLGCEINYNQVRILDQFLIELPNLKEFNDLYKNRKNKDPLVL